MSSKRHLVTARAFGKKPRHSGAGRAWRMQLLHWLSSYVVLVFVVALSLGAQGSSVLRWLGVHAVHTCACGMKPGTCQCPECAQLEAEGREIRRHPAFLALGSDCGRPDPATDPEALAPLVMTSDWGVVRPANVATLLVTTSPPVLRSLEPAEPPTPPPRVRSAS